MLSRLQSESDLGIIVNKPNIVFGQEWDLPEETSGESNVDTESNDEETSESIVGASKRRMGARDLTYVYPSRRTISRYIVDASYMKLLMVAEELVNRGDNVAVLASRGQGGISPQSEALPPLAPQ